MFCIKCGHEQNDGAKFCHSCGNKHIEQPWNLIRL